MDYAGIVDKVQNFGIGIVAVVVIGYLLWQMLKANREVSIRMMDYSQKNQEWYLNFVNENNHQKSDMIREHTEAVVKFGASVDANTKSTENYNRTLEKLIDKLEKK